MLLYLSIFILSNIFITNQVCVLGEKKCIKCNPITKLCIKCEKDIYTPDSNGGCQNSNQCIIGKNHCFQCNENGKLCKECDIDYFPDENGGCSLTDNCVISYKGECLKCKDNYILIGNRDYYDNSPIKLCKPKYSDDLIHCSSISYDKGFCLECEEGYYLSSWNRKCIKIANCEYAEFGICKKCTIGFYLDKKQQKCIPQGNQFMNCEISNDGTKCDKCIEDYYFDKEGNCVMCNYCAKGHDYACQKCIENYYLSSSGALCTTEEHCKYGRRDIGVCTECNENYYLDMKDGKCKSNQEDNEFINCRKAKGKCTECRYGAYLGQDQICTNTPNCAKSEKGKCVKCSDNYYLGLDNKCSRVEHCIYSDSYFYCIECETNYYYNKRNQTCNISEGIFENCKYGYSDQSCEKCKDGFYLNKNDSLCYINKEQGAYYKCEESYDNTCISCVDDYFISNIDHRCTKSNHCDIIEDENRCKICAYSYCLDAKTGLCEDNDIINDVEKKFYFRCNVTNAEGTACKTCLEGYELKDGLCLDDTHCVERNEEGTCKRCKKTEKEIYEQCLNNIFGCVQAYNDKNCVECNNLNRLVDCTKCLDGYALDGDNNCYKIQ